MSIAGFFENCGNDETALIADNLAGICKPLAAIRPDKILI
jgi:hypothetical protein